MTYSFSALVGGASACEQFGAHRVIIASLVGMLVYLTISLLISSAMNWYNNRVKLVER